ncbi:MAG: sugar phosphate nucleotidyltransferase [Thalassobaculum sp.]
MIDLASRTQQAVILVGGEGRRLGSLTATQPKPLISVGGVPFLEHLVWRCRANGISRILLLSGYLSDQVVAFAEEAARRLPELTFDVSIEPTPLGTAGALRHARPLLDANFFLMNGDSLFDIPWRSMVDDSKNDALAIMALRQVADANRYGLVTVVDGTVKAFSQLHEKAGPALVNAGLYWMRNCITEIIPSGVSSLEHDIFPILAANSCLYAHVADGHFIDIGVRNDLKLAEQLVPKWTGEFANKRAGFQR